MKNIWLRSNEENEVKNEMVEFLLSYDDKDVSREQIDFIVNRIIKKTPHIKNYQGIVTLGVSANYMITLSLVRSKFGATKENQKLYKQGQNALSTWQKLVDEARQMEFTI